MIDKDLLFTWGAAAKRYQRGEILFGEGDPARFYHQIMEGEVRMYHINDDGREFVQGVFTEGQSFGEPPLFIGKSYPTFAAASTDTVVIRLLRDTFLKILDEYPNIKNDFLCLMANRVYQKSVTANSVINASPETRLLAFLRRLKEHTLPDNGPIQVPFTRQSIADQTGLRVETVIRELQKMHRRGQVTIRNRKLYF